MAATERAPAEPAPAAIPNRVAPRGGEIVAQVLEGEAVIMNVRSGIYYSLEGVGGFVWSRLEEGMNLAGIAAAVAAHYEVAADAAARDLKDLAAELLREGLVREASDDAQPPLAAPATPAARAPYAAPRLRIYRDMGDLLALDPPAPSLADLPWEKK